MENQTILTEQIFHSPEGKPYQPRNWENRVYSRFIRALHKALRPQIKIAGHITFEELIQRIWKFWYATYYFGN